MLEDAAGIRRVVLACGTVDLRKGIDGLATIIGDKYGQNPFEKGTLFLFCGKRSDRCKGLLWMGTGFLLLYKRFEAGRLSWLRNTQEAAELTEEQYKYLMMGLNPLDPKIGSGQFVCPISGRNAAAAPCKPYISKGLYTDSDNFRGRKK